MKRASLLLTFALVSALTACGLGDSPEKAAQEWVQAFANLDGNKIAERTCAAQQANVQQAGLWNSVFNLFGQQTVGQQAKTDVSGLKFTTVSSGGNTANVRVIGQVRVAILALSQTQDVDEIWRMVQEDGKWKWCGQAGGRTLQQQGTPAKGDGRTFTSGDLDRLLIQPSEVIIPYSQSWSSDKIPDTLSGWSLTFRSQLQSMVQAGVARIYSDGIRQIDSRVYLFDKPEEAMQGFILMVDELRKNPGFEAKAKDLTASGLGNQSAGMLITGPQYEGLIFVWRVNNLILLLSTSGQSGAFKESDARSLADKMQSHIK